MLMSLFERVSARQLLLAMAVVCVLAVAAALIAQHRFDMQPCPWCILQRVIYLLIALLCLSAAVVPSRIARAAATAGVLVFAGLGAASAVYQHVVAAKLYSCSLTLADTIISALGLEQLLPALFQVTATCADAAVSVFGVPFEYWSLALFVLLVSTAALALYRCYQNGIPKALQ